MNKLLTAGLAAILVTLEVQAAPATPGTLSDYLALGPGGATIDSTLFSDFSLLPNQTGATPISPATVQVTPIGFGSGNPGFLFTLNQSAAAGDLFELKLSYKVSDVSITGANISLIEAIATNDAAITATLDVTGPVPQPPTLIAFAVAADSGLSEQTSFASVAQLLAATDIVVDGGLAGESRLQSATNQFVIERAAAVPETAPGGFGLATLAACAVIGFRGRSSPAKPS